MKSIKKMIEKFMKSSAWTLEAPRPKRVKAKTWLGHVGDYLTLEVNQVEEQQRRQLIKDLEEFSNDN